MHRVQGVGDDKTCDQASDSPKLGAKSQADVPPAGTQLMTSGAVGPRMGDLDDPPDEESGWDLDGAGFEFGTVASDELPPLPRFTAQQLPPSASLGEWLLDEARVH